MKKRTICSRGEHVQRTSGGMTRRCRQKQKAMITRLLVMSIVSGSILISATVLGGNVIKAKANSYSIQQVDYDDGIPKDLRQYFEVVGKEFDICPELLEAMAYRESRFIPTVKNGKHYGLMQINVKVHADRIAKYGWTEEDMFDPYRNLMIAADYLAELYEQYGDDNPLVLNVYSGNWKAIQAYKENGFLNSYVKDVLDRSAEYERIHGK